MTDGMAFNEEAVAATLHWGLDDMPLLGGSAGDGLDFRATSLILNGETIASGTILMLFECLLPVQIFKTENFVPTSQKLVVTELQQSLMALTVPQNTTSKPVDWIVNEPAVPYPLVSG